MSPLLLLVVGLRLFNPTDKPLDTVVTCDGAVTRQSIAPQGLVDFAGDDCRAAGAPQIVAIHTETVNDVDVQTLDAVATAECPTPALQLPLTGCRFGSVLAQVMPIPGATYAWAIEGGTLLSGAGTERVLIGIGSGLTLKVTAVVTSPSCGAQTAAGVMALRDPFAIKSLDAGGNTPMGAPRTITWSYDNGTPATQTLSISDLPDPITLSASARNYTYTPALYGDKSVTLTAASTATAGRTRAVARGTAAASSCSSVRAETKYHVDCTRPVVHIEAPAATGVGIPFTAKVKLAPGSSAAWTIANGTPSTATGESVSIQPLSLDPVDVKVTVSADTCNASAAAKVSIDSSLGCATPPSAKLSIAASGCDNAVIAVALAGVPPFSGKWSDGEPFAATSRSAERTVTKAGVYKIAELRDALCSGQSDSVNVQPGPVATVSTNGNSCINGAAAAVLTFTGKPPFLGEWSDSVAFNTTATRLERTITAPIDLTLKWFQDASCPGTVIGHAGFGEQGTADVKLVSPANGCVMFGDPNSEGAVAAVDLTGTPPFTVVWADGVEQTASSSPVLRSFLLPAGANYPLTIKSARDAYCNLKILNATTTVGVTNYIPIYGAPASVCPGVRYTATLPDTTPLPVTWKIDHGTISLGQGTPYVTFTPDGVAGTPLMLSADFTDPRSCTATTSKPIKIHSNAGPIQMVLSKTTAKVGEWVDITIYYDRATTQLVTLETNGPAGYWSYGTCTSFYPCPMPSVKNVPGEYHLLATAHPFCNDKLKSSAVTATLTIEP